MCFQTTCKFWPVGDTELAVSDSLSLSLKYQSDTELLESRHLVLSGTIMVSPRR